MQVGEEQQEFYVHEKLVRTNSKFFDTTLNKKWKEGQERVVKLPETAPRDFKIWVKFLYTGRVFLRDDRAQVVMEDGTFESEEYGVWDSCYALGDFLQDTDFKDALIDALIEGMATTVDYPLEVANCIYPYSGKGSAHRSLAIDVLVNIWDRKLYKTLSHPQEFLQDVLIEIGPKLEEGIGNVPGKVFFKGINTCKYHDHGPDKPGFRF